MDQRTQARVLRLVRWTVLAGLLAGLGVTGFRWGAHDALQRRVNHPGAASAGRG